MSDSLLIEIGVEELPPGAMQPLAESLADGLEAGLREAGIAYGAAEYFATPRRLAVRIADTAAASTVEAVEKQGPTVEIAFATDGQPTKAGEGFARSVGVGIDALDIEDSDKGRRLVYRGTTEGRPLSVLLQSAVDGALRGLPIPKRMRWGTSEAAFVRPVHWVMALYGTEILPLEVFGESADRYSFGHRFHHPESIEIADPESYLPRLKSPGHVIADIGERRELVMHEITAAAGALNGRALINDELVDEVVALVEWPVGVAGRFDARYLELPREVLISTLEGHQRYFPVVDSDGGLIAGFVTVANIASRDPSQVIAGNERVIRPRLSDALFFWEQDRRRRLAAQVDGLERVSFQQSLGSLADKTGRIRRIASELVAATGADRDTVDRAAELAKADLLTEMVDEFPDLQGTMGGYYAESEGESPEVAKAIAEQYSPRGSGAPIAETPAGRCLALADRLDTLAGIFAIDKRPSGDKDPFGLRRAALGVLRTLIEGDISADLSELLALAIAIQPVDAATDTQSTLWMFHMERLRGYYQEKNIPGAYFDAIAALGIHDMRDVDRRVRALQSFAAMDTAATVCGAHKRIRNILKRNRDDVPNHVVDVSALTDPAEKDLQASMEAQAETVARAADQADYTAALSAIAPLAEPLNTFFEQVMVIDEDQTLRRNRLALLSDIDRLCRRVADISCLSVETA